MPSDCGRANLVVGSRGGLEESAYDPKEGKMTRSLSIKGGQCSVKKEYITHRKK